MMRWIDYVDPPVDDERADLERQYWVLVENLNALIDRQQDLANVKGAVLGLAIYTVIQGSEKAGQST